MADETTTLTKMRNLEPHAQEAVERQGLAHKVKQAKDIVERKYDGLCHRSGAYLVSLFYVLGDEDLYRGIKAAMEYQYKRGYVAGRLDERKAQEERQIADEVFPI
jgi:hypothetical protein